MTAKEARQITKAALINTTILQNIDKVIAKAAKDGKYSVNADFTGSDGNKKYLNKVEYEAITNHYTVLGFKVEKVSSGSIIIDWHEETGESETVFSEKETLCSNID